MNGRSIREQLLKIYGTSPKSPADFQWQTKLDIRAKKAVWTTGAAIISLFTGRVAALVTVPMTLSYLGAERYGLWLTVSSVVGWLSLADFGLGSGLMTKLSEAYGKKNGREQSQLITTTLAASIVIGILLLLVFISVFPLLNWARVFNVRNPETAEQLPGVIVVIFAAFLVHFSLSVTPSVYRALQEGYIFQIWSSATSILTLMAVIVLMQRKVNTITLIIALSWVPALVLVFNSVMMFLRDKPAFRPKLGDISWPHFKLIMGLGIHYAILTACNVVATQAAYMIIAQNLGPAEVTPYGVAMKLYGIMWGIGNAMVMPLWPAYTEALASGDEEWINRAHWRMLKINALAWGLFGIAFILLGPSFIQWWVGPSATPTRVLISGIALQGLMYSETIILTTLLNSAGLVRQQFFPTVLIAGLSLSLMILMGREWGSAGVVWGNTFGSAMGLLFYFWSTPRFMKTVLSRHDLVIRSEPL